MLNLPAGRRKETLSLETINFAVVFGKLDSELCMMYLKSKVWFINKIVPLRHKRIAKLFYKDETNYITFKMDWALQ